MGLFTKDPLQIITFQSYGTDTHFYIRGRALEDENIDLTQDSFLSLLKNTYKRFETDEVINATLKVKLPDNTFLYTTTDNKGYFKLKCDLNNLTKLTNKESWLGYEISFDNQYPGYIINNDNRFSGEILIPSSKVSFGVISDIDDTIIHTGVTSFLKLKLLFNTFFRNAEGRVPLEGASKFYHLLHRGKSGEEANPMFYVSHSPWNLYRYLELFLTSNNFPKGPILLRDFTNLFGKKDVLEKPQKQKEILDLLETYPKINFILIGDSGEHDADIYIEIASAFPNRILAIYLRSVKHKKKMIRIKGLFENYKTTPVLLVKNSEEAILHARENGFIL
jgi:phosphatidate phosphatase APP1